MGKVIRNQFRMIERIIPSAGNVAAYLAYYSWIVLASLIIPGPTVKGHPSPKRGPQQTYKIIGFRLTVVTIIGFLLFGGFFPSLKSIQLFNAAYFANEYWRLFIVVNVFALLVSTLLYLKGKYNISVLGEPVDTHSHGSFGLDFWVGRELNPHIGSYDIKFNAYRVGMLFWLVLNMSFLCKQLQEHGTTTLRMLTFQFTTGFYVLDYFWHQPKMLTTWDIINEEFGHMLVFGDYVFIPFVFCLQCLFLIDLPEFRYPVVEMAAILVLYFVGYYIFRTANSQKNSFKVDPNALINGKKPETFQGKLLISGFWGYGRHMNYTGDLIMALAYCLTCGFSSPLPYIYFYYLTTLLLHRAYRDDAKCQQKYGDLWKRYCERVPYVFISSKLDLIPQKIGKALYHLTNPQQKQAKTA